MKRREFKDNGKNLGYIFLQQRGKKWVGNMWVAQAFPLPLQATKREGIETTTEIFFPIFTKTIGRFNYDLEENNLFF